MKEKPILFSAKMIRAILRKDKTQTRRVVKNGTEWGAPKDLDDLSGYGLSQMRHCCPYGKEGDRLWVRETFGLIDLDVGYAFSSGPLPKSKDGVEPIYRATISDFEESLNPKFWPSIHMPRWASRIDLKLDNIRVEKLQNITEKDAIAEGCKPYEVCGNLITARETFMELWESINGHTFPWDSNPWVWVVEFEKVTNQQNLKAA